VPLEDAFTQLLQRRADQRHHQKQKDHANAKPLFSVG
jgi:hypothetical protein